MATRQFSFVPNLFTVATGTYDTAAATGGFNHGARATTTVDLATIQPSSGSLSLGNNLYYNAFNEANVQDRPRETDFQIAATLDIANIAAPIITLPDDTDELRVRVLPQSGTTALQFGLKKFVQQSGMQPQFWDVQIQSPQLVAPFHALFANQHPLAELLVDGTIALLLRVPTTGAVDPMTWDDLITAVGSPTSGRLTIQITIRGTYQQF